MQWSPDDETRLRALYASDLSVAAVADAMGRSKTSVYARASQLKLRRLDAQPTTVCGCGASFVPYRPYQRHCSAACRVGRFQATRPDCVIPDCTKEQLARGWCRKHYAAWQAHGDPLTDKRHERKTHCPQGHEYTPENTLTGRTRRAEPPRLCRRCKRYQNTKAHQFGITMADFELLLDIQEHRCVICRALFGDTRATSPRLDHCHKNGHARGIVCNNCNVAMGLLGDDPDRVEAVAAYLRQTAQVLDAISEVRVL